MALAGDSLNSVVKAMAHSFMPWPIVGRRFSISVSSEVCYVRASPFRQRLRLARIYSAPKVETKFLARLTKV